VYVAHGAGEEPVYVLGRSEREAERLARQGQLFDATTRTLLERAGLRPGMRVLDLGCGSGAVSLLAAELVGPSGSVVGVDRNPAILETAQAHAATLGAANVVFTAGALPELDLGEAFDAVVGRLVLMYLQDPRAALRRGVAHLKPGGLVVFQEADYSLGLESRPPTPVYEQVAGWWRQVCVHAGVELGMGFRLRQLFLDVGLPEPHLQSDLPLAGGPDSPAYQWAAESIRSVLPLLVQYQLATEAEVEIETLADRLREEIVSRDAVMLLLYLVGAWTTSPG
jgi:SAM-dependent methyltransferase